MKLKPINQESKPVYPTWNDYSKLCRNIFGAAAAAGIVGVSFSANGEETEKEKPTVTPVTEVKADNKEDIAKVKKNVILLASRLGDNNFKVRQEATVKLISLGKKKDKKDKTPFRDIVISEMKKLLKNDDPEVSERAKKVINALEIKTAPRMEPGMPRAMPGLIVLE